ncbi:MAG: 3',5'-cyclic-nucleotide phosphodiesterase [Thiobacillus sp.]
MKIKILGCSGGIGSGRHTTCLMVDDDILIDAGSGITTLSLEQLEAVEHVFITHAHLDHVLGLPLLLDSVGDRRNRPVKVHALPEVLEVLSAHLFNWHLWPDFRAIPTIDSPWMEFEPLPPGDQLELGGRTFSVLPARHIVPACGVRISVASGTLAFTGDTMQSNALVEALNAIPDLRHLIIETSFENELAEIARVSMHHWPDSLAAELRRLSVRPQVWITHLKPGNETPIMEELAAAAPEWNLQALQQGQVIAI